MFIKVLLAGLLATGACATAGETAAVAEAKAPVSPVTPATADNPLSFFGGKVTFDFQERLRGEMRENNFDFNDEVDSLTDDSWLLQRARLGVKIKPSDEWTFYLQGQESHELDSDRPDIPGRLGAEGDDPIDLRQAWMQFGADQGLSLRIGRQLLAYGDERLVGPSDWSNFGRAFDAVKVRHAAETWSVDLFTSSVVTINGDEFNQSDWLDDDDDRDQFFSGLYFSANPGGRAHTIDAYAFHLYENGTVGDTNFVTVGGRLKADPKKLDGWEYDFEAAVQKGDVRGGDLTSVAAHAGTGYNWMQSSWKPRVYIEYAYGSGDDEAADGDVGTFQNLFPTNHKFYGALDLFSWQNMHQPGLTLQVSPVKNVSVRFDYQMFWLADTGDAWYRANGTTQVRPIDEQADNFAGSEIDVTVSWKAHKNLVLTAGYSHFFTGDYLEATGTASDADFGFVMAVVDF
jgi:hypothetical protein